LFKKQKKCDGLQPCGNFSNSKKLCCYSKKKIVGRKRKNNVNQNYNYDETINSFYIDQQYIDNIDKNKLKRIRDAFFSSASSFYVPKLLNQNQKIDKRIKENQLLH